MFFLTTTSRLSPLRSLAWPTSLGRRHFTSSLPTRICQSNPQSRSPCSSTSDQQATSTSSSASTRSVPIFSRAFWSCRSTWRRAGINTLRCLVGCTIGDFSALWTLQSYYPELGMNTIMLASMGCGITTSIILETVLLRRGADQLSWSRAVRTAMGMSMVSMVAMEIAENAVDYHLTGGVIAFEDPKFWAAAVLSIGAGYLAPLPYNYLRLRRYGKACH
ncbi:hypothetical protein N7539_005105 [Penicillium diatomitis]|uniref:DUF4396 domain-containing protein n=1 Tax=Penicillium diatomitis TaxID=2819901 RepID=A0A9X0BUP4_9EURO|nr:uncharacterized protein N7539_005105 [Penicillium diatomitis]KAJ5485117.1 hypothetical protein N7539_005105 [Penicillium diatomitis]